LTITIPTIEPASITAGLSYTWTIDLPDYLPSDGNTLKYYLLKNGYQIIINASTNPDADNFIIEVTSLLSTGYNDGDYQFKLVVFDVDSNGTEIRTGKMTINPNFITATSGKDIRTHSRITLDNIQATIRRGTLKGEKSYSIGGRNLERFSWEELLKAEAKYKQYVLQEEQADKLKNGLGNSSKIMVRFT